MAYTTQFAAATSANGAQLDTDLNQAGLLGTVPCSVSGTNALTMTPYTAGGSPSIGTPPLALQTQLRFSGIAANTNTGAVTANVNSFGALNVYKDTPSGPSALTGGEVRQNNYFVLVYDPALNTGAGGYHLENATSSAAGTVTTLVAGTGLAGGTITGVGTISFATISDGNLLSNISGGSAAPSANTLTGILDHIMGSTVGAILVRGASVWSTNIESTWTPVVALGGSSVGITYSTQTGNYYAIGNIIVGTFTIILTNKGAQTGNATISVPVTSGGSGRIGGGFMVGYANLTSVTTAPFLQVTASSGVAQLVVAGSGNIANLTDANLANNSIFQGVMVYFTA